MSESTIPYAVLTVNERGVRWTLRNRFGDAIFYNEGFTTVPDAKADVVRATNVRYGITPQIIDATDDRESSRA